MGALQLLGDAYAEIASSDQPQQLRIAIQYYLESLGPELSGKMHRFQYLKEALSLARMRSTRVVRAQSLAGIAKALLALPDESIPHRQETITACLLNAYATLSQPSFIQALTRMIPSQEGPSPPGDSLQLLEIKFDILILLARAHLSSLPTESKEHSDVAEAILRVCAFEALRKGMNAPASQALLDLGDVLFKSGRFGEAVDVYDIIIRHIETSRIMARLLERRADILRYNTEPFDRIIAALVEAGRSADAFEYMERGKSLSVSDLLGLRRVSSKGSVNNADAEKYAELQLKARTLGQELARTADQTNGGMLAKVSSTWLRRYTTVQRQDFYKVTEDLQRVSNRLKNSDVSFGLDVERLGNAAIHRFAGQSKSALVFFRVTATGTYVFIVAPSGRCFGM